MNLEHFINQQSASGAFPSFIATSEGQVADENCFITALMVLKFLGLPKSYYSSAVEKSVERALDFIERCESTKLTGSFGFYPDDQVNKVLAAKLNPDCDDTALALLVLLKNKRRSKEEVIHFCKNTLLLNQKYSLVEREAPWVKPGLIQTWLKQKGRENPVDMIANINVAALLAFVGLKDSPCYITIIHCLHAAIRMTGGKVEFMRMLAPYYAHPVELWYALERAISHGAWELSPVLELFQSKNESLLQLVDPQLPICCNAHGRPLWYAPLLQELRLSIAKEFKPNLQNGGLEMRGISS